MIVPLPESMPFHFAARLLVEVDDRDAHEAWQHGAIARSMAARSARPPAGRGGARSVWAAADALRAREPTHDSDQHVSDGRAGASVTRYAYAREWRPAASTHFTPVPPIPQ